MGKITEALKKAAEERLARLEKRPEEKLVVTVHPKTIEGLNIDPHIVLHSDPHSPISEQYKILRTNLQSLSNGNKPVKSFIISSAIHGEGKTVTAINLAIALATDLAKKSVILIDADLRKSKITKYLGIDTEVGLSEYLTDGLTLDSVLLNTGIENLTLLPAGKTPHNPAELLGSFRMKELLGILKPKFDFIIFDTPPVIPVTDPGVIGSQVDGVVMVIQAGRTQRGVVQHAASLLNQARAKLLGYIMTSVEFHLPHYLYKYYRYQ